MMKKRFTPKTKQTKPLKPTACTVNHVNLNNRKQSVLFTQNHGLRTPNEGINQRYLKNWADVADKICFGCT